MEKTSPKGTVEHYVDLVIRKRWFLIVPFLLAMAAGIVAAFTLPKLYEASTLMLVQSQSVPANYVRSVVSTDVAERLRTISKQIMSRTSLEGIIADFNLFAGREYGDLYLEDKIEILRERIAVGPPQGERNANVFAVSFKGEDPAQVMQIANRLASYFIEENLRAREAQAVGTSQFLEDELKRVRRELIEKEKALQEFREKNMGTLPEQLASNLKIIEQLQTQLNARQAALRDARNRLQVLRSQGGLAAGPGAETDAMSLPALRQQLANLRLRYTERHPDVVRLKGIIADLEAQNGGAGQPPPATGNRNAPKPGRVLSPQQQLEGEVQNLEIEIAALNRDIQRYQRRIEGTPQREQELLALQRDYQNMQEAYNSLLDRKLEAELAVNLEKKQKGEQFRILDAARMPIRPVEPNMPKILLIALVLGLGSGGGLLFLVDYMDSSFRKPEEVESYLGVPVLATIPTLLHPRYKFFKRVNRAASMVSLVMAALLFIGLVLLTINGVDQTLLWLKGTGAA